MFAAFSHSLHPAGGLILEITATFGWHATRTTSVGLLYMPATPPCNVKGIGKKDGKKIYNLCVTTINYVLFSFLCSFFVWKVN